MVLNPAPGLSKFATHTAGAGPGEKSPGLARAVFSTAHIVMGVSSPPCIVGSGPNLNFLKWLDGGSRERCRDCARVQLPTHEEELAHLRSRFCSHRHYRCVLLCKPK